MGDLNGESDGRCSNDAWPPTVRIGRFVFDRIAAEVDEETEAVVVCRHHRASVHHIRFEDFSLAFVDRPVVHVDSIVIEGQSPGVVDACFEIVGVFVQLQQRTGRVGDLKLGIGHEFSQFGVLVDHLIRWSCLKSLLVRDPER